MSNTNTVELIEQIKQQCTQEIDSWKRLVIYMQQEYIFLKIQLVEIIKADNGNTFLQQVELFQNAFITEESVIADFKLIIHSQEASVKTVFFANKFMLDEFSVNQKSARKLVENLEYTLVKLKYEYNNWFSKI